ncbi:MAG: RNA polymerase sigma factor [Ruminiclostridium sp.]|nr:RNA polymerase sigma factor [Ruminiclostridium sp.]
MLFLYMAMLDEPEDKALFEHAYTKYKGKMIALAYNITGNYHDAEEAVSNAFFKIAGNFEKLKKRTGQERAAYYCVVTKNCAYDILREKSRRGEIPIEDEYDIPDGSSDVSDEVLSEYSYRRVVEAIRSLPEIYAQALYLQNVTGLSVREIASDLGVTEAVVRKRLERARCKLRELLEEQGIEV